MFEAREFLRKKLIGQTVQVMREAHWSAVHWRGKLLGSRKAHILLTVEVMESHRRYDVKSF
jgi:hypothetical protein